MIPADVYAKNTQTKNIFINSSFNSFIVIEQKNGCDFVCFKTRRVFYPKLFSLFHLPTLKHNCFALFNVLLLAYVAIYIILKEMLALFYALLNTIFSV
jgi:hypothetical protein